jgi:hypothetical protein
MFFVFTLGSGFYCPGGQSEPEHMCPVGHRCAAGRSAPEPCPAGQYQNVTGQWACETCLEAYYCEEGAVYPVDCPAGYYCHSGTRFATEFACPRGTFSDRTRLLAVEQCTPCSPGSYCAEEALTGWNIYTSNC